MTENLQDIAADSETIFDSMLFAVMIMMFLLCD